MNSLPVAPLARAAAVAALALATTGKTRFEVLSNVPTMNEAGVPDYEAVIWLGLIAPRGTPPAIVERLNAGVGKFASDPQTVAARVRQGTTPMTMTPAAFSKFLQDDIPAGRGRGMRDAGGVQR